MNDIKECIEDFQFIGVELESNAEIKSENRNIKLPKISIIILGSIICMVIFSDLISKYDPTYMDLKNYNLPPSSKFLFGTDGMGRDLFSMILNGGKISIFIGIFSTLISTIIAIIYGGISGLSPKYIDNIMMRFTEIILSIPSILLVVFMQGIIGIGNAISISIVIGVTSWITLSKVIRNEVIQIRVKNYVLASKAMGAKRLFIIRKHIIPNLISTITFMIVMNIRNAIAVEATLSFLGIGLPIEVISWGSILSLAQKSLLTNSWWIIFIPGIFLVTTIMCITNIGKYMEKRNRVKESYL